MKVVKVTYRRTQSNKKSYTNSVKVTMADDVEDVAAVAEKSIRESYPSGVVEVLSVEGEAVKKPEPKKETPEPKKEKDEEKKEKKAPGAFGK